MGFSRQAYGSGLPVPAPGDLPDPGIKRESLASLHWQADSLPLPPPGKPPACLLNIDYVPNSSPSFLHVLTHIILTPALRRSAVTTITDDAQRENCVAQGHTGSRTERQTLVRGCSG